MVEWFSQSIDGCSSLCLCLGNDDGYFIDDDGDDDYNVGTIYKVKKGESEL